MYWLNVVWQVLRNAFIYAVMWVLAFIAVVVSLPAVFGMLETRNEFIEIISNHMNETADTGCRTPFEHYSSVDEEQDRSFPLLL